MFSGIVQKVSTFDRTGTNIRVALPPRWRVKKGDSVSVDGVCLTVAKLQNNLATFDLMPETLRKTTFGCERERRANLEPALRASARLSGHIVTGHVDGTGMIRKIVPEGRARVLTISFPAKFRKLIAPKGSIAVDGISLTVIKVARGSFTVSLVPYTLAHTTLGKKSIGSHVNLEFDIMAKYGKKYATRTGRKI